ncbi:Spore coat polysaccharide biosynthesis protein SpsA [Thiorhodovibrio winogradskyi]|uniref:Spore coat polysaccharide biosynthesis protein SpsA n=1 Tax=Thiorhodovibrio winogradskyi TaxID=77007 RepID=A0ABZ0S405_9GAMM|nr:glycosyltransferase family A protein [Thiorhodovibrio winogradskyi]
MAYYQQALAERPALAPLIRANLRLAWRRLARQGDEVAPSTGLDRLYRALPATSHFAQRLRTLRLEQEPPALPAAIAAAEQAVAALLAAAPGCWCATGEAQPPLVSVIMLSHNRATLITEAIASVLEQRYGHWELWVCDDGSTDHTAAVVARVADARVHYLALPKQGAAAARNQGLRRARGALIAYLDTDNLWHPDYLATAVALLQAQPGRSALYMDYLDCRLLPAGQVRLERFSGRVFDPEALLQRNFIDLNAFVHRRELFACLGGFDESLVRLQDYALILTYSWLRDPLYWPHPLNLYLRDPHVGQITQVQAADRSAEQRVRAQLQQMLDQGPPRQRPHPPRRLHILSWDSGRNHFSKPFALAEALRDEHQVQLLSFDFFNEGVFEPLRSAPLPGPLWVRPGSPFPDFFARLDAALEALRDAEVLYVVKPRLPSLGLALLANRRTGVPLVLEVNDLETVVNRLGAQAGPAPCATSRWRWRPWIGPTRRCAILTASAGRSCLIRWRANCRLCSRTIGRWTRILNTAA